jgi:hypothetical protein
MKFTRWLTGVGLESQLLCPDCSAERERDGDVAVQRLCGGCLEEFLEDHSDPQGVRGTPGIVERPRPFDATLTDVALAAPAPVRDAAPVADGGWVLLCEDGSLLRWDGAGGTRPLARVELPAEQAGRLYRDRVVFGPRLHVSPSGAWAAVVNDYGRLGVLVHVASGAVRLRLDGGEYHPETVPFSFAFVEHGGRELFVHRTAWNRLDVTDPATGELLTAREHGTLPGGERSREHFLDYFHGRLHVSPDGRRVLDDGWVWTPVGVIWAWALGPWIDGNVWESEDGPSRLRLGECWYHWDRGMCWIDERRVAIGGVGDDDLDIVPAARILGLGDPGTPGVTELGIVPGPSGELFGDGERLFSAGPDGLSIWDVEAGARTGQVPGFVPARQHRWARELIELGPGPMRRWRY